MLIEMLKGANKEKALILSDQGFHDKFLIVDMF